MDSKFRPGDVVHLESGSPSMTVGWLETVEWFVCYYADDSGTVRECKVPAAALKPGHGWRVGPDRNSLMQRHVNAVRTAEAEPKAD